MRISESELIINGDGTVFHLHMRPDQLADRVILMGDPDRVELCREYFDVIECEHRSREFNWITGMHASKRFTVLSTGIGTDNVDIVMTELDALANVDFKTREVKSEHRTLTILRVGTCGALQEEIPLGAYIFSHISIGFDNLMYWYKGIDSYALADYGKAFKEHMDWNPALSAPYFVRNSEKLIKLFADCTYKGMTIAAPGFYGPQGRTVRAELVVPDLVEKVSAFEYDGRRITNFEMEGSAIAGLSALLGHECATVCCAVAHRVHKDANTDYKPRVRELLSLCFSKLAEI